MNLSRDKLLQFGKVLLAYLTGQGMTQILQLVSGFCLINWLSKGEYGVFTLVMAIHSTASVLSELTIAQSLTALIGKKIDDAKVVGRYIAACRYYRDRMLFVGCIVVFLVFLKLAPRYDWTHGLWFWLWLSVVLSLIFNAWTGIYTPIFLLKQNFKAMYSVGIGSGLIRLILLAGAYLAGVLTAPLALMFGAVQACVVGWGTMLLTKGSVHQPGPKADLSKEKKEILGQSVPRMPSTIFYAFEGQVAIFIIGYFGSQSGIAEIGALSRLAMLFLVFKQAGGILINPYFAKLDTARVRSYSLLFVAGALILGGGLTGLAYVFPELFLFVLGKAYAHLGFECFLIILATSIRLVTMVVFSICMARKYIYPWFSVVDVVPLLIVMAVGFAVADLSVLASVIYLTIAMEVTKLVAKVFILMVGLRRESRKTSLVSV